MSPFLSGSGTSNQRTRMLLEVVAKADTLVGPHRGTGGQKARPLDQGLVRGAVFPRNPCAGQKVQLTGLPRPPSDRTAPGAHPDAVQRLDPDFVFRPLLQVLDGELSLLAVGDDVDQRPALRAHAGVLDPVAHLLGIPVVFPFGQRLVGNTERRPASAQRGKRQLVRALSLRTIHLNQRLVSLAVRSVTLAGATSGGAGRVWIFLEGWLGGLVPTMLT